MSLCPTALALAEVWISTPQKPGAGAKREAFYLSRAHFLGSYWYLAKIDALVTEHYHLPLNVRLEVPI